MKKQQKTDYFENTTKPSLLLGEASFTGPLLEKTNPISQIQETLQPLAVQALTAIYSPNSDKKNEPKTNPNEPNLRHRTNTLAQSVHPVTMPVQVTKLNPTQ